MEDPKEDGTLPGDSNRVDQQSKVQTASNYLYDSYANKKTAAQMTKELLRSEHVVLELEEVSRVR